ncbi:unnamed protein product [Effrenium voratum]|nr:unnamed protein product [Effrenium voratum]
MAAASGSAESLNVEASEDELSLPSDPESVQEVQMGEVAGGGGGGGDGGLPGECGCCQHECLETIKEDKGAALRVQEIQMAFQGETKLRVSELKFELMKQFLDCEKHDSHRRFNIFGFAACRNALASVLTMSKNKVVTSAFTMWAWVHEFLAEPLAEANIPVLQLDIGVKAKALLAPSQMGSPELPSETRHLHPGTALSELLQVAKSFLPHLVAPSYRTWVRVFHKDFKEKLRFRGESQHAKCNACERFKAFKREAATTSDSEMVAAAYVQHLDAVMRDRRADALWRQAAVLSMTSGHSALDCSSQSSWLGITVDGMDISKFKVPLNVCKSKEFQAMHRPELKLTLAVVDGQVERFFLSDPTVGTTANKDLTIITHCIEAALQETLKRGVAFPRNCRVHADNASAETKNQTSFKYGAFLVFCDIFDDFVFTYFRAGHSHGLPDQRFSEVRHHLFASDVLQHPEDFLRIINQVRPREGRVLQAETLSSQWNFKAWLEQLPLQVHGHTSTQAKLRAGQHACQRPVSWQLGCQTCKHGQVLCFIAKQLMPLSE